MLQFLQYIAVLVEVGNQFSVSHQTAINAVNVDFANNCLAICNDAGRGFKRIDRWWMAYWVSISRRATEWFGLTSRRTGPGCFDLTRHVLLTDSNNFPIAAFSVCQLCSASQFHTLVRQAEFGRACLKTFLENSSTPFHYLGLVREKNHADLRAAFESEIYKHWDEDATLSPPKTRPPSTASQPSQQQLGLELLAMENGAPVFSFASSSQQVQGRVSGARGSEKDGEDVPWEVCPPDSEPPQLHQRSAGTPSIWAMWFQHRQRPAPHRCVKGGGLTNCASFWSSCWEVLVPRCSKLGWAGFWKRYIVVVVAKGLCPI